MRIGDRNHADGIAAPKGGYARQRAAVVPVQGKVICHDEVDNAASQSLANIQMPAAMPAMANNMASGLSQSNNY